MTDLTKSSKSPAGLRKVISSGWGLLAHTGASLQSEIPLLTRKFCGKIPSVSPQAFSKARNKMNYTSCKELFEFSAKKLIFHKQYKGYFLAAVAASKILPPDTSEIRNVLGTCGNQFSERAGALVSLFYDPLSDHIINGILSNCNESERKNIQTENIAITRSKQHLTSYLLHGI